MDVINYFEVEPNTDGELWQYSDSQLNISEFRSRRSDGYICQQFGMESRANGHHWLGPIFPMRLNALWIFLSFWLISCVSVQDGPQGVDIFVSVDGNDSWSGLAQYQAGTSTEGPFRTVSRALDEIALIRRRGRADQSVTVHIGNGTHYVAESLVIDSNHSGGTSSSAATTIEGEGPGTVISGGKLLNNCAPFRGALLKCDIGLKSFRRIHPIKQHVKYKGSSPPFDVFQNGSRLTLARWPNASGHAEGYEQWSYISSVSEQHPRRVFRFDTEKFPALKSLRGIQAHLWPANDWFDEYLGVDEVDTSNNQVTLRDSATLRILPGQRFYLRNALEFLDEPGEWYFSPDNAALYLYPIESAEPLRVEVSWADSIISINGAEQIVIQRLVLEKARGSNLEVRNSKHIQIEDHVVRNSGGHGIRVIGGTEVAIRNGVIFDTGLAAAEIIGGDRSELISSRHEISGNEIFHSGQLLRANQQGIIARGVGVVVRKNHLHHLPHAAIRLIGNDHLIEENHVHDVCLISADCGGIYIGRDWTFFGNVIRRNIVHDIRGFGVKKGSAVEGGVSYSSPNRARGIYIDDAASGISVLENIVYEIGDIGIQIGGGRYNTVENNIVQAVNRSIQLDARWSSYPWKRLLEPGLRAVPYKGRLWKSRYPDLARAVKNYRWPEGNVIVRNILISSGRDSDWYAARYNVPSEGNLIDSNLVWNHGRPVRVLKQFMDKDSVMKTLSWDQWLETGQEPNSVLDDPLFKGFSEHDFRIEPQSPVFKLGIVPLQTELPKLCTECSGQLSGYLSMSRSTYQEVKRSEVFVPIGGVPINSESDF